MIQVVLDNSMYIIKQINTLVYKRKVHIIINLISSDLYNKTIASKQVYQCNKVDLLTHKYSTILKTINKIQWLFYMVWILHEVIQKGQPQRTSTEATSAAQ